jgi:hypothetical protein
LIIPWLSGSEVDPQRTETRRAGRLGSVAEHIRSPGDLEIDETGGYDRSLKLCFQQSAGNSAGP